MKIISDSVRWAAAATAVVVAIAMSGSFADPTEHSAPGFSQALLERSLLSAMQDHPRDYVAGLIEVTSDGDCRDRAEGNDCTMEVKVVEFLAGRFPISGRMRTSASPIKGTKGSYVGDRVLVIAVPSGNSGEAYAWSLAVASPSDEQMDAMRAAVVSTRLRP